MTKPVPSSSFDPKLQSAVDSMSVDQLMWHGSAMLDHGWKVKACLERGYGYRWTAPTRPDNTSCRYWSPSINVASAAAVANALEHKDYEYEL